MIDNVKDLSRAERLKLIERKKKTRSLLQCLPLIILVGTAIAVFGIYLFGDINDAFTNEIEIALGKIILNILFMVVLFMGIYEYSKKRNTATRDFNITAIIVIVTYLISAALARFVNIYVLPISLATFVIMELIDKRISILVTILLAFTFLVTMSFTNIYVQMTVAVSSIVVNTCASIFIIFFAKFHYTRIKFLLMTLLVPLFAQLFNIVLTIMQHDLTINILYNVLFSYAASVGAALIFMPIVTLFESAFNIADDFRLNELCSLSNPLLKRLASEAPGTFNHSLVVANLAEACASAIGENPNMARCGAYYHDIGKLKAPIYFSENQSTYNPHDELIPEVSVSMITSHTLFGEILAKQTRLPKEIVDICRQHHGTSSVSYFYRKALTLKEEGDLAVEQYKYSGPKPQTKIAAIIMISDTIEAAMRAYMPDTKEEYESRISSLVDEKITMRQFDECPITMGDIDIIKKTIMEVLPSIHHSRINYDKKKQ